MNWRGGRGEPRTRRSREGRRGSVTRRTPRCSSRYQIPDRKIEGVDFFSGFEIVLVLLSIPPSDQKSSDIEGANLIPILPRSLSFMSRIDTRASHPALKLPERRLPLVVEITERGGWSARARTRMLPPYIFHVIG